MPFHSEKRTLPYSRERMFDLVADVERYPEFLPWCVASRITRREEGVFYADLTIGYKMFREKFTSRVTAAHPEKIHVDYLSGPMKNLSNRWIFIANPDGSCTIDFHVDFEFRNPLLQAFVTVFFNEIVKRMVKAFEDRAREQYG